MPILLLLVVSLAAGLLIGLAFDRLAPAEGATTALADAAAEALESKVKRTWWQMRTDPNLMTGLALTAAVAMMIGGGLLIAILALLARGNSALASIDSSAADWGHEHATQLSTRLLIWVTDLGDWPVVPLIGVVVLLYEWRRFSNRLLVAFLLVVFAGNELVTLAIKDLVDRARPTLNPVAATLGPSFPSGHSSTAASFYAALALILARRRSARVRALLAGAAGAIAVGVASSRVLLDVHWLSDVIAGVTLGWVWFTICAVAFGGRRLNFAEPVESAVAEAGSAPGAQRRPPQPAAKV
jgi:undecaprenyl-diphosphatase